MLERNIFSNEIFNNKLFNNEDTLHSIEIDYLVPLCAQLSVSIYNAGYYIPPGWNLLHTYEDSVTGYRGVFYTRNLLTTDAQVLVVHRGTILNFVDIIGDIQIATGHVPFQINSINKFLTEAANKVIKIYVPDDKEENNHGDMIKYIRGITTGHSMGAILSDYVGLNSHVSITFENPGSKPIIQSALIKMKYPPSMIPDALNRLKNVCQVYQGGVNIVNTCNEQVGRTFRISSVDYNFKVNFMDLVDFPPMISYISDYTYLINNTIDQHSIEKMAGYFREGRPLIEISNAVGFQAGYVEYLNPLNTRYWENYMNQIWASSSPLAENMRKKYNNERKAFVDGSYAELYKVYEQAKKVIFSIPPNEKLIYPQLNLFDPGENQKIEDTKNQEGKDITNEFTMIEKTLTSPSCN